MAPTFTVIASMEEKTIGIWLAKHNFPFSIYRSVSKQPPGGLIECQHGLIKRTHIDVVTCVLARRIKNAHM